MRWVNRPRLGMAQFFTALTTLALLTTAAAFIAAPLTGAWFRTDDYGFLAIARYLGSPLDALTANHFPGGVYFRPVGLWLWWLADQLGAGAFGQYAISIALHGAVAGAVAWLARCCGASRAGACTVGLLFLLHPAAVGTVVWLSNRFDLLATLFMLLALAAGTRHHIGWCAAGVLLAVAAFLSKEIGFAVSGGLAVALLLDARRQWPLRLGGALLCAGVGAVGYWWRATMLTQQSNAAIDCLPCTALSGAPALLRDGLAYAIGAWPSTAVWPVAAAVVALTVAISAVCRWRSGPFIPRAACAVTLVLTGAISAIALSTIQPPLPSTDAFQIAAVNSRHFYAIVAIGLALGGGLLQSADQGRGLVIMKLGLAMLAILWLINSSRIADRWAQLTDNGEREFIEQTIAKLGRLQPDNPSARPCVVEIETAGATPSPLNRFIDVALKARLQRPGAWQHCLFRFSGPLPYYALLSHPPSRYESSVSLPQRIPATITPSFDLVYPALDSLDPRLAPTRHVLLPVGGD